MIRMKKFKIVHTEKSVGTWYVDADSPEGAIEEFLRQVYKGQIDFSYMDLIDCDDVAYEVSGGSV